MSNKKHVTIRHKSLIKFVFVRSPFFYQSTSRQCVKSQFVAGQKYSGVPSSCGNQKENLTCIKQSKTKKKKVLHIWACSHGWECDKQAVSVLAVCMCVWVCECASRNLNGQYTDMSTFTHTHTENNGWKKSVKATSSDSQGNTIRSVKTRKSETLWENFNITKQREIVKLLTAELRWLPGVTCGQLGCGHLRPY